METPAEFVTGEVGSELALALLLLETFLDDLTVSKFIDSAIFLRSAVPVVLRRWRNDSLIDLLNE